MDRDKEIIALEREIWWHKKHHEARELYLLRRIEQLEEEIARFKNDFGDK